MIVSRKILERYWKKHVWLISSLLIAWFTVSLGMVVIFPEYLANIKFGKLPLPFWLGQQGAVLSFIVILVVYAITMDRMEEQLRQNETCEQVKLKVGA